MRSKRRGAKGQIGLTVYEAPPSEASMSVCDLR